MKLVVSSKLNKNTIDINNYKKKELTSNTSVNLFISSSINSKKDIILSFKKIRSIKKYTDKKNIVIKNIYVFDNPLTISGIQVSYSLKGPLSGLEKCKNSFMKDNRKKVSFCKTVLFCY